MALLAEDNGVSDLLELVVIVISVVDAGRVESVTGDDRERLVVGTLLRATSEVLCFVLVLVVEAVVEPPTILPVPQGIAEPSGSRALGAGTL